MKKPIIKGSIRRRLSGLLTLVAAIIAVFLYFLIQSVARQIAQSSQDNILVASAISIIDSSRFTKGELSIDLPYSSLSMLDTVTDERVFYSIKLDDKFLSGYKLLPQADVFKSNNVAYLSSQFLDQDVRVVTVKRLFSINNHPVSLEVSVAQTLNGLKQTLAGTSRVSVIVGVTFFMITSILSFVLASSAVNPLARLTKSISKRGPKDLRPVAASVPAEMVPLVSSLNSLMHRLEKSLTRSEDFITEAAHRVRTPLTVVRAQAEITLRQIDKPRNRKNLKEIIRAIDESSRAAGQLLDHAMVTFRADNLALEKVNVCQLINDTVDRLRPLADLRDISLEVELFHPASVLGDTILLQNALYNIIDNAIKYSPIDSKVVTTVSSIDKNIQISVNDTGPGFNSGEPSKLIERFQRGENVEGIIGSGLGLTIVHEVVEAHKGHLEIKNLVGGGACVSFFLPSH
jgi:two-component system sensor histidine kinase TctE|tara:strand:- start:3873 stop:5249 length:1377 start_codon:yes stop_codon:yes gene_type:complete